jgi:hypothetical protein
MVSLIRKAAVAGIAVVFVAALGCASSSAPSNPGSITDGLTKSLGVSGDQASGGIGSILSLAQNKMPASDYTKVANAIPGSNSYVEKAKDLGAVPSGGITDKGALDAAYQKLGISPDVAKKFTPMVVSYAGQVGGSSVESLLSAALK